MRSWTCFTDLTVAKKESVDLDLKRKRQLRRERDKAELMWEEKGVVPVSQVPV